MPKKTQDRIAPTGPRNTADFRIATAAYNTSSFDAPPGTLPEDLLSPEYWKHIVAETRMKRRDIIRVCCKDGTWEAEYVVVHTGPLHAKLRLRKPGSDGVDWIERETGLSSNVKSHEVVNGGEVQGWIVRRLSDNEAVKSGFESEDQAIVWMHQNSRLIAA